MFVMLPMIARAQGNMWSEQGPVRNNGLFSARPSAKKEINYRARGGFDSGARNSPDEGVLSHIDEL
jgi:hypothetical protein